MCLCVGKAWRVLLPTLPSSDKQPLVVSSITLSGATHRNFDAKGRLCACCCVIFIASAVPSCAGWRVRGGTGLSQVGINYFRYFCNHGAPAGFVCRCLGPRLQVNKQEGKMGEDEPKPKDGLKVRGWESIAVTWLLLLGKLAVAVGSNQQQSAARPLRDSRVHT